MTILRKNLFAAGFAAVISVCAAAQSQAAAQATALRAETQAAVAKAQANVASQHTAIAVTQAANLTSKINVARAEFVAKAAKESKKSLTLLSDANSNSGLVIATNATLEKRGLLSSAIVLAEPECTSVSTGARSANIVLAKIFKPAS